MHCGLELGPHLDLVTSAMQGTTRHLFAIRHSRSEEHKPLTEDTHRLLMLINYRRDASQEAKPALPVQLAAGPSGLIEPAVIDFTKLRENRLPLFTVHLEHRGEVLEDENLVAEA